LHQLFILLLWVFVDDLENGKNTILTSREQVSIVIGKSKSLDW
jgi:hypothetical protein